MVSFERSWLVPLEEFSSSPVLCPPPGPAVLRAPGARVHGRNAPAGLRGAAVVHRQDREASGGQPGCGLGPAASQSGAPRLPPAPAAGVRVTVTPAAVRPYDLMVDVHTIQSISSIYCLKCSLTIKMVSDNSKL